MPRRDSLAPVELVEGDQPPEPDTAARRRPRWWLWAAPVVVVAAAAGAQLVADARARSVDARIAALPGALNPLGDSLDILWRTSGNDALPPDGPVAHGRLHGVVTATDGARAYVAIDLRTGERAWSTSLDGTSASPDTGATCLPAAEQVVCLVTDGHRPLPETGDDGVASPTSARIVVLDLADGRVLADRPTPAVTSIAVLPGLVAVANVDDQRNLVVVASDPITGEQLWRYRHDEPVRGVAATSPDTTAAFGVGGLILLYNVPGGPVLLSATGELVDTGSGLGESWGLQAPGWFYVHRANPDGIGRMQKVFRGGEPPMEVIGELLERAVDDGSAANLEVSIGDKAYAWDATTGERLWSADVGAASGWRETVLILEGTVYLSAGEQVVALDARTGATRWTAPGGAATNFAELLTDGAHVLLVEGSDEQDGMGAVTVLDRRDGSLVRRLAMPDGVRVALGSGGYLVGVDEQGLVGLG